MHRRLLAILIALSLSWVTAGYACSMAGAVAQPACCCDEGSQQPCPNPSTQCALGAMTEISSDACCSIIVTSGAGALGKAETLTVPDLPLLTSPEAEPAVAPISLGAEPSRLTHDRSTPRIYLLFGHLLR